MPDTTPTPPLTVSRRHRTIYPPSRGTLASALDPREVFEFRDLLLSLAVRDVKLRYRQTALGVLWVVLQPLIAAGIFTFVFGRLAGLGSDGVPYFAFAFAGQVIWGVFANTLIKASGSLVGNASLVSKVFFPRLVLPLSTIYSTLIDFAVSMAVLSVILIVTHVVIGWQIVTLPLWFAAIALLSMGGGLFAAALMVSYRDVQYVVPVLLNFLLFASPIGWGMSELARHVPKALETTYLILNPLSSLIAAFRWSLFGRGQAPWSFLLYSIVASMALFLVGAVVFRAQERRFADVI